jgi:hypothetical protein
MKQSQNIQTLEVQISDVLKFAKPFCQYVDSVAEAVEIVEVDFNDIKNGNLVADSTILKNLKQELDYIVQTCKDFEFDNPTIFDDYLEL